MMTELLATKLRVPPLTSHLVSRPRLTETLEDDIPTHNVAVVLAPAGYGKTTLLAQWARTSRHAVAWLSMGEHDNDPERFLRYLVAAWAEVQPSVRESRLGVLLEAMAPDIDAVLSAFINVGASVSDHTIFVLDDIHLVGDEGVHRILTFLCDHLPPTLHVVLAGRGEPPLPLARYRARGQLVEYSAEELKFGLNESREFLCRAVGSNLDDDLVADLQGQLEGWIAGLQLASLSVRNRHDPGRPAPVTGRQRFIADYVHQEVLAGLPEEIQHFLLQTSILDRLSGPLCDAVTARADSQAMLELLERENLFILPADENREWYRYHRLFGDVLNRELRQQYPGRVAELHRRAARWYLDAGLPEPAFEHALAANDDETGIAVFDRYVTVLLHSGQQRLLRRWLDALPDVWHEKYPTFGLAGAGLLLMSGEFEAGVNRIDEVERKLSVSRPEDVREQLARVTAVRCFIACMQNDLTRAEQFAGRALRELPDGDAGFRPVISIALGDSYRRTGLWAEAEASYRKAMTFTHAPVVRVLAAHVFGALADLQLRQGYLRTAADYWGQALAAIQDREGWESGPVPVCGWVELRLGELLYEWNELEEARTQLARALDRAELGGDTLTRLSGYVIVARLKLTDGDIGAATDLLERARPLVAQAAFPDWVSRFERCQLELWLAQDKLRAAVDWAEATLADGALDGRPESEPAQLALAYVLMIKGDAPSRDRALTLLGRLLDAADLEGRIGVQIEALAMQGLARWASEDRVGAMTVLERALRLAEPEGYIRLFVDLGRPMHRLLQEAHSRGVMLDYVARLLGAANADLAGAGERELAEPLSEREQDVLRLVAAGLTNREAADSLFISPETVKKHTISIYGKLGVRSRMEAVARARDLNLLD